MDAPSYFSFRLGRWEECVQGGNPAHPGGRRERVGVGREDAPGGPAPAPLPGSARDVGDVTAPREEPPPYCLE